jgi:hypothetical protein
VVEGRHADAASKPRLVAARRAIAHDVIDSEEVTMHSVSRWFLRVILAATFVAAGGDASSAKIDIDSSLGARCASRLDGEVCPWNFFFSEFFRGGCPARCARCS